MIPKYLNLKLGAKSRLQNLRNANPADWRKAREYTLNNWASAHAELSQGSNGKKSVWYCHTGPQFRNEIYADQLEGSRIEHEGWYADDDCNEKVRGIVAKLSHGRYLAGYKLSDSGERVYFDQVFLDNEDASIHADHEAEKCAEIARDDSEKFHAALTLETKIEDSFARLRECLILRNYACMGHVRSEILRLISTIRESRERLSTEFAGVL